MARVFTIITLSVAILLAVIFSYLKINSQAVSTDKNNIMFVIKEGDSLVNISQNLKSKSLIRNKYSFLFYAYKLGLNSKIQAGTFRISPSLSNQDLITKLSKGGVSDYWLKIIEGTRVEENIDSFPKGTSFTGKEGYLFPDSYLIPTFYTADQIFKVIETNFDKKFAQAKVDATNTKLTDKQILVLASIIEHEARTLKVKQGVAGVLMNRININMPLQSDVTVQYARDSKEKPAKYWVDLDAADISILSPFNTYKNPGLPPSPICNPGYDSIYAAFHPTESNYLYYLTGNDNQMHYAATLDQHNSNIANYLK
ncbi:MAG: endolytic transglycosylase MltG [Candidatus Shapirobacteria bacterium]|nr:endolytic transglycosylase MltG [Candidatus Shapirobacteria bacterium]MDD4410734.1 endolytic transglycosylase MltG [Candidatus Shapirobacteria bacterium]